MYLFGHRLARSIANYSNLIKNSKIHFATPLPPRARPIQRNEQLIVLLGESPIKHAIAQYLNTAYSGRYNVITPSTGTHDPKKIFHVVLLDVYIQAGTIMLPHLNILQTIAVPNMFGLVTVSNNLLLDSSSRKATEILLAELRHNERNPIDYGYDYVRYTTTLFGHPAPIGDDLIRVAKTIKNIIKTFE